MRRWCALVACVLGGCYAPAPPEGAPCGEGLRPCPAGQRCSAIDNRCYRDPQGTTDGPPGGDGAPGDGTPATTCTPRRLLTGGTDVTAQGWTIERVGAGTIAYAAGSTMLATTNDARQLIVLRDAFPPDRWTLVVTGDITASGGCMPNNAAAAVMASFHDPTGDANDQARMLCFTADGVRWGDGGGSVSGVPFAGAVTLAPTSTGIRATFTLEGGGTLAISSGPFTTNGSIAIGDQTTAAGLDSQLRIQSVDLMCP